MKLDIKALTQAIDKDAAIRRIQRLQPVGGKGDKIFPPTYPGEGRNSPPRHVYERRRIGDTEVVCVLVDSVQSQANRMEEVLLNLVRNSSGKNAIKLPFITVDFTGLGVEPIIQITSLEAPHRVYDAIMRDSNLDGTPFMQSALGERVAKAGPSHATALLELSPSALVFGAWHSQGQGGGLGAKFARTLVSEIVAVDTPADEFDSTAYRGTKEYLTSGRRPDSRMDPLGIRAGVEVYKDEKTANWSFDKPKGDKGMKKVKPSKINHSNIAPGIKPLGVTCSHLEHRSVVSLAGVRRLQFDSDERNTAARALLVSLALIAITGQDRSGYALRSRCDLVCENESAPFELVHPDGSYDALQIDHESALELYGQAYSNADSVGFEFQSLSLTPQDKLVKIIQESQKRAIEGHDDDDDEG